MRIWKAIHAAPLVCLLAACNSAGSSNGAPTGSAVTTTPPPVTTASATVTASASAPAPVSAEPVTSAAPVVTASAHVDAGAPPDAGAKPQKADAGAPDAGAAAAVDAGAADAGAAAAPPGSALAMAQQVDAIFAAKSTFTAKFTQHFTVYATGTEKTSTGVVFIERPSKFSFRYDPPNKDRVVSDGTTIKIYRAEESQMNEIPAAKTEYPGALSFMMGSGISKSFEFAFNAGAKKPGVTVLDGKPLAANPTYEKVLFFVDEALLAKSDPGVMRAILVLDAQKNRNRFEFQDVAQPASIPAAEFTFTPPPGTNVVK